MAVVGEETEPTTQYANAVDRESQLPKVDCERCSLETPRSQKRFTYTVQANHSSGTSEGWDLPLNFTHSAVGAGARTRVET